ncbi:MAG: divalent cation tolerance protein CutA [Gammaproteobacteria bacterium]
MKYIAVVTTISDLAEAQSMARALVERKLAACVQISEIESFYSWNESNSAGQ